LQRLRQLWAAAGFVEQRCLLVLDMCRQVRHGGRQSGPISVPQGIGLREIVTLGTFLEFVEASPPEGLGTTMQMLKNVCRDDRLATDLIDEAVRNPVGTNQYVAVNNVKRADTS
jgi:hypothetical protein